MQHAYTMGRNYIRHPSDIPIEVETESRDNSDGLHMNNVSCGGLSFRSAEAVPQGLVITVRINVVDPPFEALGRVAWCHNVEGHYDIGVEFVSEEDSFRARMVEQVCHIEQYKQEMERKEGRYLSGEQAALEWIEKYAELFPNPAAKTSRRS